MLFLFQAHSRSGGLVLNSKVEDLDESRDSGHASSTTPPETNSFGHQSPAEMKEAIKLRHALSPRNPPQVGR